MLLRASPSSQPPSLPEINFSTVLPTKCITYSVLPNASIWHYICTLDFKMHFKLVVFLGIRTETSCPSGFLPGTTSYVYVRCRTYHVRHRASDVRCRIQHRTYDIVRTMLHATLNIRHRMFVNIVGATNDIVGQTYDIVRSMKCMSYAMLYVPENLLHRRFVNSCRIRCRRS